MSPNAMTLHTEVSTQAKLRNVARSVSRAGQRRILTWTLLISDAAMLGLAFTAAYLVRFDLGVGVSELELGSRVDFYSTVVFALIPTWLLVFLVLGLYEEKNLLGGTREYALVFSGVSTGMLLLVIATFANPGFVISRGWVVYSWLLAFLTVSGARFWIRRLVYALRGRGYFVAPALIVGSNTEALAMAEQLIGWRTSGMKVLGFVNADGGNGDNPAHGTRLFRNLYVLGDLDDLPGLVDRFGVEEVIVATSSVTREALVEIFRRYTPRSDVELRLSSGLFEIMTTGLSIREVAYVPLVNVDPVRLIGVDRVLKGALDYGVATVAVLLGLPIYALIALAVRLDSPGPIIHRRRVLGQGGQAFDCFKFRTMHVNGDEILAHRPDLQAELADNHKLKDDPRVTRLGGWLRKTSLDELPQFFNVLLGQMSVVGPRMISPAEHEKYGRWDLNLLTVKPGITGLWQVSGRSDISYEERVQLDMSYIRNWTIWMDLQLLLQTIPAVLKRRGAY